MSWLGTVADVIGIVGAIFALFAWINARKVLANQEFEKKRQSRKVRVILRNGASRLELPVELRRAELTRSEILGRLGMIPMKKQGARFAIAYTNTPEFLERINTIILNHGDEIFEIPCTPKEFDQFDLKHT